MRDGRLVFAFSWLCGLLGGCASDPALAPGVGRAVVSLAGAPAELSCLRVVVSGTGRVDRSFDLSSQQEMFVLERLPLGKQTFTGYAFESSCASLSASTQPSWQSDEVEAALVAGVSTLVRLVMHRTGQARVTFDFDDDARDAAVMDASEVDATIEDASTEPTAWKLDTSEDYPCGWTATQGDVLLAVGLTAVNSLSAKSDRVVGVDTTSRWVLWDAQTRRQLASGDGAGTHGVSGEVFVIMRRDGAIELRDLSDGRLQSSFLANEEGFAPIIDRRPTSGVSDTGGYMWHASPTGLRVWSLSGQLLAEVLGDYSLASVRAMSNEVRVETGLHTQRIERIQVPGGVVALSASFVGFLAAWFDDGEHFITSDETRSRIYSINGSIVRILDKGDVAGGYGRYFWTISGGFSLRSLDTGDTILTFPDYSELVSHDGLLALSNDSALRIVDLRGDAPAVFDYPAVRTPVALTSDSQGHWAVGTDVGTIYSAQRPGASLTGSLGCGRLTQLAAARSGRTAIGTLDGYVRIFDIEGSSWRYVGRLPVLADALALSADGSTLAVTRKTWRAPPSPYPRVYTFSLPGGELLHQWMDSYVENAHTRDVSLASESADVAHLQCMIDSDARQWCRVEISSATGQRQFPPISVRAVAVSWVPSVRLSPNGKRLVVQPDGNKSVQGDSNAPPEALIYEDGASIATLDGGVIGWLDDQTLLVNRYEAGSFRYLDTILTDVQGRQIGTNSFALPREYAVALPDATHFYAPATNKVYSWIDGSVVWTGTAGSRPGGAITGSHLLLLRGESGVEILPWR